MNPVDTVRAAARAAIRRGIPLHWMPDPGVLSGCLSGEWCLDEKHRPRGVNLIGAVLLIAGEPCLEEEDPADTAARALGVSPMWVAALSDGWSMEAMDSTALRGCSRQLYLTAYELGVELRHQLSRRCACGARVIAPARACDPCADRARDAEDTEAAS